MELCRNLDDAIIRQRWRVGDLDAVGEFDALDNFGHWFWFCRNSSPETAAVVRDLFCWFANEGVPIYRLQQRLEQLGIVSPRGYPKWNGSALHGILTNRSTSVRSWPIGPAPTRLSDGAPLCWQRALAAPGRRERSTGRVDRRRPGARDHRPRAV
jgi:Recombinase